MPASPILPPGVFVVGLSPDPTSRAGLPRVGVVRQTRDRNRSRNEVEPVAYFDDETFAFLRELRSHNERAWFNENKDRYERSVKEPMLQFIGDVGPELRKLSSSLVADPRPVGGSMFRIYRDVRFSKDKSPYKTHAGAHFQSKGGPGYYLHIAPAQCFIAGGMWMPEPAVLQRVRERISKRPADWKKARVVLDDPEDALKRPPRGFDADDPMIEEPSFR